MSIKFIAKHILFESAEGYKIIAGTVFDPNTDKKICNCSIKGQLSDVKEFDEIYSFGRWYDDQKYGRTFISDGYTKVIPADKVGIFNYLKRGNIAGITEKRAEAIVDRFGVNTLDVITYQTHLLKEIKGIGAKTIEKIKASATKEIKEQKMLSSIMMYIQQFDISPAYALKIYNTYGIMSLDVLKKNPYKLADDIKGIGFLKADEIAIKNGVSPDSPFRIDSAMLYSMKDAETNGHTYLSEELLIRSCMSLVKFNNKDLIRAAIPRLVKDKRLVVEGTDVFLPQLYWAEINVAKKISDLMNNNEPIPETIASIKQIGKELDIEYEDLQAQAILTACKEKIMVLTGGPGTGKTTTVNGIIEIFHRHHMKVLCAAPTGKAAKKMQEATGEEAFTIHRLLGVMRNNGYMEFRHNTENPLCGDALIVDESSMIDVRLISALLKAIPWNMKLILVGDVDQLPSVGCGNVLKDIINSGVVPIIRLKIIFRQAEGSDIIKNSHLVNEGIMPNLSVKKESDFYFVDLKDKSPEEMRNTIVRYVTDNLPRYYKINADEIQVLSPMKNGHTGVFELNTYLQKEINPGTGNEKHVYCNGKSYKIGDKLLFMNNNYDTMTFNGDIGKIVDIQVPDDSSDNIVTRFAVDFDDNRGIVWFDSNDAVDFTLAYAMTVHKSQGSEYPVVVMVLTKENFRMLQRNLLYTGITRAKRAFILFGQRSAVAQAVKNKKDTLRNTKLCQRLQEIAAVKKTA